MATTTDAPQGISVKDLLDAGVHFGHQTKRWNPKMKRFIFDKRNRIHIIDLTKTLALLNQATDFLHDVAAGGKPVLFVGTKKQAQQAVQEAAQSCGQFFVTNRWLGGTLTNSATIRANVKRMRELEATEKSGGLASMPKKEVSNFRRELFKLKRNLDGIADMNDLPGAIFIVDINREAIAVAEAKRLNIPVAAIVDTNCDPDNITYVIPGNDDAIRSIKIIVATIAEAVKKGVNDYSKVAAELARKKEEEAAKAKARREADAAAGIVTPETPAAAAGAEARKPQRPRRAGDRDHRRPAGGRGSGRPHRTTDSKPAAGAKAKTNTEKPKAEAAKADDKPAAPAPAKTEEAKKPEEKPNV